MMAWIVQSLGWLAFAVLAFLLGNVFRPFTSAYARKKGENLATKEDIAQLTKTQEEIRTQISDKAWDRQRQWELKRDVVIDLIRALADLDQMVGKTVGAFTQPPGELTEEASNYLKKERMDTMVNFRECSVAFARAHTIADFVIHGDLSRAASGYYQKICTLYKQTLEQRQSQFNTGANKELAKLHNTIILAARRELKLPVTDDLPVLDWEKIEREAGKIS